MRIVFFDVGAAGADAVTVGALARLQLEARRHGCQVQLRNASAELRDLVAFMGLRDVLPAQETATSRGAAAGRRAGTASRCRERT